MEHPIVIVGAGPIGLAAAANAAERGLPYVVLEQGPHAGATVAEWAHVRLFSAWRELVDPAASATLLRTYWTISERQIAASVVLASPSRTAPATRVARP